MMDHQSLDHDRILGNVQNTSKLSKKPGVVDWGAVGRMKRTGNSLILGVSERKKKPSVTNEVTNICQSASKTLKGCGQGMITSATNTF